MFENDFLIIAGPCVVESKDNYLEFTYNVNGKKNLKVFDGIEFVRKEKWQSAYLLC